MSEKKVSGLRMFDYVGIVLFSLLFISSGFLWFQQAPRRGVGPDIPQNPGITTAVWNRPEVTVTKGQNLIFRKTVPDVENPLLYLSPHKDQLLLYCQSTRIVYLWNFTEKEQVPLKLRKSDSDIERFTFELGGIELNAHRARGMIEVYNTKTGLIEREFNLEGFLREYDQNGDVFVRKGLGEGSK